MHARIPRNSQELFRRKARPFFLQIAQAFETGEMETFNDLLPHVVLAIQCLLKKPTRGGRSGARQYNRYLTNYVPNDIPQSRSQIIGSPNPVPSEPSYVLEGGIDAPRQIDEASSRDQQIYQEECKVVQRMSSLARDGFIGRALQLAESNGIAPISQAVVDHVTRLNPTHVQLHARPLPPTPPTMRQILINENLLLKVIRNCNNGAGAGISGINGHVFDILAQDAICLRGISAWVLAILNNDLDTTNTRLHTATRQVPLWKNHLKTEIRPLGIPERILNIALRYARSQLPDGTFEAIFEAPSLRIPQLSVGAKGGCETAIHYLKASLEASENDPNTIMLLTDMRNAFGSIMRAQCLEQLYTHQTLAPLWAVARLILENDTDLLFMNERERRVEHQLTQEESVTQGGAFSSFLFSLAVHTIYQEAVRDLPNVYGAAIADDLTLVGPKNEVMQAFERLCQLLPQAGPQMRPDKTVAWWPRAHAASDSASFIASLNRMGIQVEHCSSQRQGVELLGSFIGTEEASRLFMNSRIQATQETIRLLRNEYMPSQLIPILIRQGLVPKIMYLLRTMPPTVTLEGSKVFDGMLLQLFLESQDLPTQPNLSIEFDVQQQNRTCQEIALPQGNGGLGISRSQDITHAAYYSSVAEAAPYIWKRFRSMNVRVRNNTQISRDIVHCMEHFKSIPELYSQLVKSRMVHTSATSESFWGIFTPARSKETQHIITSHIHTCMSQKLVSEYKTLASKEKRTFHLTRLLNNSAPGSSRVLSIVPSRYELQLSSRHTSAFFYQRLGIYQFDSSIQCSFCKNRSLLPDHAQTCRNFRPSHLEAIHNSLRDTLTRYMDQAGIVVSKERLFRHYAEQANVSPDWSDSSVNVAYESLEEGITTLKRYDIVAHLNPPIGFDISVSHGRPGLSPQAALQQRYNVKLKHFHGRVWPLIISSTGSYHPRFKEWVKKMAEIYADSLQMPIGDAARDFKHLFVEEFSIVLARMQAQTSLSYQCNVGRAESS
jgi:hypothetical protein